VVFMAMPLKKLQCVVGFLRNFMFHKGAGPVETGQLIARLSDRARRDGILALESELERIPRPIHGLGPEDGRGRHRPGGHGVHHAPELTAMPERHKAGKKFFDS